MALEKYSEIPFAIAKMPEIASMDDLYIMKIGNKEFIIDKICLQQFKDTIERKMNQN